MRAPHQEGEFPYPVKYGYSLVARVLEGPSELLDKRVFCLHPHQTEWVLHREEVTELDDDLPSDRAVLAANMETALNALWDAGAGPGERIAVVGAGVLGLLVGYLAVRLPGAEVCILDIDPDRAAVASALGIPFATPGSISGDCDLVFHASASETGLATAIDLAGFEATVVEMSWYGTTPVSIALGGPFHGKRLSLLSSQVGAVAPRQRPRWSPRRRLGRALELLKDPCLDALMDQACPFEQAPHRLRDWLGTAGRGGLCHRFHYI